ncbi:Pattern-formation protein/guanine nucleotide exchange factor, partial [Pseudoloma neurophilia]
MLNILKILTNLSTYPFTTSEFLQKKKKISLNHIEILTRKSIYDLLFSFLKTSRYKNLEMKVVLDQIPLFIQFLNEEHSFYNQPEIEKILINLADQILSFLYENDPYITQALVSHFTALFEIIRFYLKNLNKVEEGVCPSNLIGMNIKNLNKVEEGVCPSNLIGMNIKNLNKVEEGVCPSN